MGRRITGAMLSAAHASHVALTLVVALALSVAIGAVGCDATSPAASTGTGDSGSIWGAVTEVADLVDYQSRVLAVNDLILQGVSLLDPLTSVHSHDILSVLSNSDLALTNTAQGIAYLQQASSEAHALVPPAGEEEFHAAWVAAVDEFAKAGRVLKRGIEEGKEKLIIKAFSMMSEGTKHLGAATDLISQ